MISIHQSQFLPWLPFWFKVLRSDVFVMLDDVQYQKNGVQNRNQIKTPQGALWLTVPVSVSLGDPINRIRVADVRIYEKLCKTLRSNYSHAPFFDDVYGRIEAVFRAQIEYLHELNHRLFLATVELLGAKVTVRCSSTIPTAATRDARVREIIQYAHEQTYLSGPGALQYMELGTYASAGIDVAIADFTYREYPQQWQRVGFVPNLSVIDLLFNDRDHAREYILCCGSMRQLA